MAHGADGPATVFVNIYVRSISKIDDVTMVSARGIIFEKNANDWAEIIID